MLTIQISPQLHHVVKQTRVSGFQNVSLIIQSLSSMISQAESKALLYAFENKGKKEQDEPNNSWV